MDSNFVIIALLTIIAFFVGDKFGEVRTVYEISKILKVLGGEVSKNRPMPRRPKLSKAEAQRRAEEEFEEFKQFLKQEAKKQGIDLVIKSGEDTTSD